MSATLPPLPPRQKFRAKGWFEDRIDRLDAFLERAANSKRSWWTSCFIFIAKKLVRFTIKLGQRYPYFFRPWLWISFLARKLIQRRVTQTKKETARTLFLRRLFSSEYKTVQYFNISYAFVNWLFVIFLIIVVPAIFDFSVELFYAYGTYGSYNNVTVTQAYRNITNVSTYSVHGYRILPDGKKEELYFSLGPNIWYWDLYPELVFGQIPVSGKCNFKTYGITLRVPTRLHFLTAGSVYVLNPWIVSIDCTAPTMEQNK